MYNPGRPTTRVMVTPMPMVAPSMTTISTIAAARGIGWNLTGVRLVPGEISPEWARSV